MKRLGQHFLKNKLAIKIIVAALDLRPGDTIVEIGAGHGELTEKLKVKNEKLKIKIVAIEKDGQLANELANNFRAPILNLLKDSAQKIREDFSKKNLLVIDGDALRVLGSKIFNFYFLTFNYKIVGNIPYYITGHLLRIIGQLEQKPEICAFTLQKEVAERIAARPPKMNRLAASVQFWAEPKIIGRLSKKDFEPQPGVESAIITLTRTDAERTRTDAENYYRTVRILFQQPRKTILNNLAGKEQTSAKKEGLAEKLRKIGVDPENRPQNLSVEDIIKISELFASADGR